MRNYDDVAADLEVALHRILSRNRFSGPGHIHVSPPDQSSSLKYVISIDLDAARIVARYFSHPSDMSVDRDPVTWVIEPERVRNIVAAAR
jgi:hypothetical protein